MKLRALAALCIVLLAACTKDNTPDNQNFVTLPTKVWYYYDPTGHGDTTLTATNLYAYDTIYYNSLLQISRVVMYMPAYPNDSIVLEFTYNSGGNLTKMKMNPSNSRIYFRQTYDLRYNSAGKLDSIGIDQGVVDPGSDPWYGVQLKYNSKGNLERINSYTLVKSKVVLMSFTNFYRNSSDQTDSVDINYFDNYKSDDPALFYYTRTNIHFQNYGPNDTATLPPVYLFKLAATRTTNLVIDIHNNGFLYQYLSPKDMLMFRPGGVRTTQPLQNISYLNQLTRDENGLLTSSHNILSQNGPLFLLSGLRVQHEKFQTK